MISSDSISSDSNETMDIVVEIASTPEALQAGMDFCGERYLKTYNTRWAVAPDILFVAKSEGEIIATVGLEIGAKHDHIGAEKYFHLTPQMKQFIADNRSKLAEFGRFSSVRREGARAVLHAMISYMQQAGLPYLFAWANPSVFNHGANKLGVNMWSIDVEVNREAVLEDTEWVTPPTGFFFRENPPQLLFALIPFMELMNDNLAISYGKPLVYSTNELALAGK